MNGFGPRMTVLAVASLALTLSGWRFLTIPATTGLVRLFQRFGRIVLSCLRRQL